MNPITCGMAADLLPLYLDGCCSADSRAALEAHMDWRTASMARTPSMVILRAINISSALTHEMQPTTA